MAGSQDAAGNPTAPRRAVGSHIALALETAHCDQSIPVMGLAATNLNTVQYHKGLPLQLVVVAVLVLLVMVLPELLEARIQAVVVAVLMTVLLVLVVQELSF